MVSTPRLGRLVAAVLLTCVLGSAPAWADPSGLGCEECGSLPEGYTIDVSRCQALKPLLWGKPAEGPPKWVSWGRFHDVDLAGDGSHPARVWVGVSDKSPFFAVFDKGAKEASVCSAIGTFSDYEFYGSPLYVHESEGGLPYLSFSASVRAGYCIYDSARAEVAYLPLQRTWAILHATPGERSDMCAEKGKPTANELRWQRHRRLHADGVSASRRGDLATAERLWRQVEAELSGTALHDLGLLLLRQGRLKEAEPRLLSIADASMGDFPFHWLDLADFLWVAKQRAWAARAYRGYLDGLAHYSKWHPKKARPPEPRALRRAAPAPARKPQVP